MSKAAPVAVLALGSEVRALGNKSVKTTDGNTVVLRMIMSGISTVRDIIEGLCTLTSVASVRQGSDGRLNDILTRVMDSSDTGSRVILMVSLVGKDFVDFKLLAKLERRERVSIFDITVIDAESETLLLCGRHNDVFNVMVVGVATVLVSVSWVSFMTVRSTETVVNTTLWLMTVAVTAVTTIAVILGVWLAVDVVNRIKWFLVIRRMNLLAIAVAVRMDLLTIAVTLGMNLFAVAEVSAKVPCAVIKIKTVKKIMTLRRLVITIVLTMDEMTMFFLLQISEFGIAGMSNIDLFTISVILRMNLLSITVIFGINGLFAIAMILGVNLFAITVILMMDLFTIAMILGMNLFAITVVLMMDLFTIAVILGMDLFAIAVVSSV